MRVEIKNETGEQHPLWGTKLLINGVEMPELANVEFKHESRKPPVVHADLFAHGNFQVEIDAEVHVSITALPGFDLICEPSLGPGQLARRYYTVPAKVKVDLESRL